MGSRGMFRGSRGGPWGPYGGNRDVWGILWGHRVGLMSLLIIYKARACIQVIKIFSADGRVGPPEVVQEVLADLKTLRLSQLHR